MNVDTLKDGIPVALLGVTILLGASGNVGAAISFLAAYLISLHMTKWL